MVNRKILLVDDEQELRERLMTIIKQKGYDVQAASNGEEALELFQESFYPVVITDLKMPKVNGLAVLKHIKKEHPQTQVIIITGYGQKDDAIKALKLHAFDYIEKGYSSAIDELLNSIERAFTEYDIETENIEALSDKIDKLGNLYNFGITYIEPQEYTNQDESFKRLIETNTAFYLPLDKAYIQGRKGNYQTAAKFFHEALEICPYNAYILLHLALTYEKLNNFDRYKQYCIESFETDPVGSFYVFDRQRKQYEKTQKALHEAEKARAEIELRTQKEMLSFLTHTLRNTFVGGPRTVQQILQIAHNDLADRYKDLSVYKVLNNLATLQTIFTMVSNMIDTYKLYVSDPETVKQKWQDDQGGTESLFYLFALVLQQVLGRIMFEEQHIPQLRRLVALHQKNSIKEIRESFLHDILILELTPENAPNIVDWLNTRFPVVALQIDTYDMVYLNPHAIRFNILFACISEIVFNALKYVDSPEPVRLEWCKQEGNFVFTCQNVFSEESILDSGSGKGLAFIKGLTKIIEGIQFFEQTENSAFIVRLQLQETLLEGGNMQ
ncbi:MAG: response regulator [Candidatus Hodarchaeota archaeon]